VELNQRTGSGKHYFSGSNQWYIKLVIFIFVVTFSLISFIINALRISKLPNALFPWDKQPKSEADCSFSLNPALVRWGLCDPSLLWLTFFFETVTNTDIAFHVFFCMSFLTMSHTFARFCVFSFIFYLCLFPLGDKWTPLYLPCSVDNCLQNAENAVCLSVSIYSKVPKTKSCLFVDIWVQTCSVKYYFWEKNIAINFVYIMVFLEWGHVDPMVLLT
jgi:hypothetical protein